MNLRQFYKKLILGTVQLGLPYGINNRVGKPDQTQAFRILEEAHNSGIEILDSAEAYGNSLNIIGSYHNGNKPKRFKVISKFINDGTPLHGKVQLTIDLLGIDRLYAYMYHRYEDYLRRENELELIQLKNQGIIERIGISVYFLNEFKKAIDDETISVIQIPYNPFDASNQKKDLLKEAKAKGKEIHVRSVFLQGLFFKKPEELSGNLLALERPLHIFHETRTNQGLSVMQACLNFALHEADIDHVLIGVETTRQLDQNLKSILPSFSREMVEKLNVRQIENTDLLNPSNWKP